jgi:hypothetical protein
MTATAACRFSGECEDTPAAAAKYYLSIILDSDEDIDPRRGGKGRQRVQYECQKVLGDSVFWYEVGMVPEEVDGKLLSLRRPSLGKVLIDLFPRD